MQKLLEQTQRFLVKGKIFVRKRIVSQGNNTFTRERLHLRPNTKFLLRIKKN